MRCPNCNDSSNCKYEERNPHTKDKTKKVNFIRKNFKAKCAACNWQGNI